MVLLWSYGGLKHPSVLLTVTCCVLLPLPSSSSSSSTRSSTPAGGCNHRLTSPRQDINLLATERPLCGRGTLFLHPCALRVRPHP